MSTVDSKDERYAFDPLIKENHQVVVKVLLCVRLFVK